MPEDKNQDDDKNVADEAYKRKFATSKQLKEMEAAAAEKSVDGDVKSLETHADDPHWKTTDVGKDTKETDTETKSVSLKRGVLGRVRHGSAYGFIIGIILVGVWFSSVFAPNVILVNIKEMFTNDLTDATTALYTYDKTMLNYKIGHADCGDKDTIKCKLTTMSRQEVKSLEKAGFTVNGDKVTEDNLDDQDQKNNKPESRFKVTSIDFPHNGGSATDADSFEKNTNKSSAMKALVYSVFNPKSSFFMDARYKQRIKWRYDLTKNPTVSGNSEDAVNKSFDASMQGKDETIDKTGQGAFSLKTLGGKGSSGLQQTSETVGNNAYSYVGLQCAYYTQGKIVSNDAHKAKQITVARFAMQYLKAADQIKAGLASEMPANTLSAKLAQSSDGGYTGKNATDTALYRNIVFNQPGASPTQLYNLDSFDSIGALFPAWLQTLMITAPAIKGVAGVPGGLAQPPADIGNGARQYCLEGQKESNKAALKPGTCPALTIAGTPPPLQGAVGGIAGLSDRICPMPPKGCCWMMYPTTHMTEQVVMPYVANMFTGAVSGWANQIAGSFDSKTTGVNASDAIFAGTGEILGDMAMSRGMRPGDVQSMTQYLSVKTNIDKDQQDIARYQASQNPMDIDNKYSFMGSFVRSLGVTYNQNTPILSSLSNIFSLIPSSLTHLNTNADAFFYIQPRTFDPSRLICPDAEYNAIGIKADVACNVRYSMSQDELNAKPDDVLKYMLDKHSDLTDKNVQELQKRQGETDRGADTQDQADVQRMVSEAQQGQGEAEIDKKTGKALPHSEYEKFLTYCVNREDPWGRSAMVVERKQPSDDEMDKALQKQDRNGIAFKKGDPSPDPYGTTIGNAYMSVTEGASADQDWYTGKKCLENSEELKNFRAYTMMCSVDGSHSGAVDCTYKDKAGAYFDGYYNNNDIIYTSWF